MKRTGSVLGRAGTVLLAMASLLAFRPASAGGLDDVVQIHIGAQPLTFALIALARQTGLQVMMATSNLEAVQSPGADGRMTARMALEALLDGTSLRYREVGNHSVAVLREESSTRAVRQLNGSPTDSILKGESNSGATRIRAPDGAASAMPLRDSSGALDPALLLADQALQEIIVTAEKLAVDVMHAPVSMTALNGDTLQANEIHQMEDLQFFVPGMTVTTTPFSTSVNIRGIGLTFGSPNIAQGVPIYRDGLLVPASIGDEPLWDVANVQVLRGPQGTLVGANSTGGAMYINSVNPTTGGEVSGYAQAEGGSYHHAQVQAAVNLPLGDTFAARLGAYYERRDSFSEDLTAQNLNTGGAIPESGGGAQPGDLDMLALRGSILWKPGDQVQLLGKVEYFYNHTGYVAEQPIPVSSTAVNGVDTPCPAPGSYLHANPASWSQVPDNCGYAPFAPADPYQIAYGAPDTLLDEQIWRESLEGRYRFENGPDLRLLAGASFNTLHIDNINSASPNYTGGSTTLGHEHTLTYEADLLSQAGSPFQWVAGAFWWTDPSLFVYTPVSYSGGPFGFGPGYSQPTLGTYLNGGNRRSSDALFGNVTYQFSAQWKLEAGARETWDHNANPYIACPAAADNSICYFGDANAFHFLSPNPGDPWGPLLFTGGGRKNLGAESDALSTWKLALDYNLAPQNYLYAEIATGAKAGGIRTNVPNDNFAPERDTDFEVGWKATGFAERLSIQLDAFYMNYADMQIRAADVISGQASIYNAGHADDFGAEFALQAAFSGWQLAASGSVVKSSFTLGDIVNQDACNLYAPCYNENAGQCPPGVPNGPVPGSPGSNCFNYRNGGAYINGQFFPWVESVNGLQLPNSATVQGNVSVGYQISLSSGGSLTPRLDLSYQGRQFSQIYDTPLDLYPARTNLTARLSYDRAGWLIAGFATNLTGAVYPIAQNDQNAEILDAPRQFGLRVTRRW